MRASFSSRLSFGTRNTFSLLPMTSRDRDVAVHTVYVCTYLPTIHNTVWLSGFVISGERQTNTSAVFALGYLQFYSRDGGPGGGAGFNRCVNTSVRLSGSPPRRGYPKGSSLWRPGGEAVPKSTRSMCLCTRKHRRRVSERERARSALY